MKNLMAVAIMVTALAAAFSGCLGNENAGTGGGSGNATAHENYSASYSDFVGDMQNYEFSKEYTFPVDEGAKKATVNAKLGMNAQGLPFPPSCYITVSVKDPAGSEVGSATLDPITATEATITLTPLSSYGNYVVRISGYGMAGYGYGGKCDLKIEVNYGL